MWEAPIVVEIHRTREKLAAAFNYDIEAMFADMRKRQEALGDRLVRLKTPPEPTAVIAESEHGETPLEENRFTKASPTA